MLVVLATKRQICEQAVSGEDMPLVVIALKYEAEMEDHDVNVRDNIG